MGALHAGHLELCRRAREENGKFVASLFVNPAQFGPHEDLGRYPRPFERDCEALQNAGCDALFAPTPETMYGSGGARDFLHGTWVDVSPFDEMWEGVTRPGHLRGVATIVAKLFNIVRPTHAYFGEKDFQQLRVVQTLAHDLNFDTEIVPVETVRESDGLALSSRNVYLSAEHRAAAATIPRATNLAREMAGSGERDVKKIGCAMQELFDAQPLLKTQYVAVVDAQTLTPLETLDGRAARLIVAVFAGDVRLIDNIAIS